MQWVFVAARAFSSFDEWGLPFFEVCRLLIAVASLVTEPGLQGTRRDAGSVVVAYGLMQGLVVVTRRLSCPMACGIFPDRSSDWCPALIGRFLTAESPGL